MRVVVVVPVSVSISTVPGDKYVCQCMKQSEGSSPNMTDYSVILAIQSYPRELGQPGKHRHYLAPDITISNSSHPSSKISSMINTGKIANISKKNIHIVGCLVP